MILNSHALQTILKLIIQMWLFGLFLYFFGQPALKRYQEKEVVVVTSRQNINGIQAPAVTIAVSRKGIKTGWKKDGWAGFVQTLCNDANDTKTIVSCIEQQTYNLSDIATRVTLGANGFFREVKNPNWTEDFTHNYAGRTYTLDLPIKFKSNSFSDNLLKIGMKTLCGHYEIYIHDPTYFYVTRNPEPGHPSIRKVVNGEFGGNPSIYLFALTEIVELNVPHDPCNEDPDYNFRKCLKESFATKIGCRTKWDDVQLKDLSLCASIEQFK